MASSKPVRTLEEREAAYAEARLRILGSSEEGCLKNEPVVLENTGLFRIYRCFLYHFVTLSNVKAYKRITRM